MEITIIYDNQAWLPALRPGWGFACLVRGVGLPVILFDTGADGPTLLRNMDRLGLDPGAVDTVFISHGHYDHIGGLSGFLEANSRVRLYLPASVCGRFKVEETVRVDQARDLGPGIHSTGELASVEQSLVVERPQGNVVVTGCSHPGVGRILERAARYGRNAALIGGLHGFRSFGLLQDLDLLCPTHCSMYSQELARTFPEKCITGGAGRRIEC